MKEGWTYKKLGEVCVDKKQIVRASNLFLPNEIINYIDISSIDNSQNVITSTTPIFFDDAPSRAQQVVKIGDVLISLVRPNLRNVAIVNSQNDNLVASSGFCILRTEGHVNNRYIFYIVKGDKFTNYLLSRVQGANYPAVREDDIKNYLLPLPPIAEQERIVAELDLLQGIIEKKKEQLKAYDQLAQSIFYTMFGDPIDNPKGWEVKKMGKIGTMKTGYTPSSTDLNERGEYPYFKVGDMNTVGNEKYLRFSNSYLDSSFKSFPKGAIVFPKNGAAVATNKKRILSQDSVVDLNTAIFISDESVNLEFIYRWICQIDFRKITRRGAVPTLDTKELLQMNVFLPPLSMQQEFAEKVEAIERQKALVQQSIDETQTMFDYTMDKYFG